MGMNVIREEEFSIKPFSHVVIGDKYAVKRYEDAKAEDDKKKQKEELKGICWEDIPKTNRLCKAILKEYKDSEETDDFSMKVLIFYSVRKDSKWLEDEVSALHNGMYHKNAVKELKTFETLSEYRLLVDNKEMLFDMGGDDTVGLRYHYKYNYLYYYMVYLPYDMTFDELKEDIKTLFNIK